MSGNPLMLYLRHAPGYTPQAAYIGKLTLTDVSVEQSPNAGIHLRFESAMRSEFLSGHQSLHWVELRTTIEDQRVAPHRFGTVHIDSNGQFPAFQADGGTIDWLWRLNDSDIEDVEVRRSDAPSMPLAFKVVAGGILQANTGVFMVRGEGHFQIAVSDWEGYITTLGYRLPPKAAALAGLAATAHPSWKAAEERLKQARSHLRAGEGHAALTACLKEFEREVTAPYSEASWDGHFSAPDQKLDGLRRALAGHCTYLNKVGHHLDRKERTVEGGLAEMPVDQWEAELAVGASQFWLAYAIRGKIS